MLSGHPLYVYMYMAVRRNRDRDSGINDPGDETLEDIERLNPIQEASETKDEDGLPLLTPSEELPEDPEKIPEDPDMANPAPTLAPAAGVVPGQLSALPLFDGERGEAFINWLEIIENAQQTYGWTDDNVLSVVCSKGGPKNC